MRLLSFVAGLLFSALALAQSGPIKVGMSMPQTGPLGAGGQAALLALRMWVEDVNAKGGLLGRKVELIAYDDQTNPALTPAIYAKLLDVDKVDLLIAPYGTVPTAPIMPLVKQRGLLLMGNFSFQVNNVVKHDMWFNNSPWNDASSWSDGFIQAGQKLGAKTIAFLAADNDFAQNLANGARTLAQKAGLQTVYNQNYPPATTDFSSLNGIVNYNSYVPGIQYPGIEDFLKRYSAKAVEAKVDPLGFYLPPFNYAIGQMLEQAINATKSLEHKRLADYLRTNEMRTIVGPIKYGPDGEWANARVVQAQFRGVTDKNMEQFRQTDRQIVLYPSQYKTGDIVAPFEKARGK